MYDKTHKDLMSIIELLEKDGSRWSQFFQKALVAFERGEYQHCADIILSGSGGMGSLNDLVLGQSVAANGQFQWMPGYKEMNQSYQELLSALYDFSQGIQRAANKSVVNRL